MRSRFRLIVFTAMFFTLGTALEFVVAAPAAQRVGDIELPPITYLCPMNSSLMADGSIHADVYEDNAGKFAPDLQDDSGGYAARIHMDLPGPFGDPRTKGRPVPDRQARARPDDGRSLVDLCGEPGDRSNHARQMPGRFGDGCEVHGPSARKPQPAARRTVLHGSRQLDACRGNVSEGSTGADLCLRRLYETAARRQVRADRGRVITRTTVGGTTEEASFPLVAARNGSYLEAKVDTALRAAIVAKLTLKTGGPEYQFDFTFKELTKEPAPAASTSTAAKPAVLPVAATRTASAARTAAAAPSGTVAAPSGSPAAAPTTRATAAQTSSRRRQSHQRPMPQRRRLRRRPRRWLHRQLPEQPSRTRQDDQSGAH